jgi:O-antigen ligase
MTVARVRDVASGLAAAGMLVGLAAAGGALPAVALGCALLAIAARPHWLPRHDLPAAVVAAAFLTSALLSPVPATAVPMLTCLLVVCGAARLPADIARALFAGGLVLGVLVLALVAAFELAKSGELRSTDYPGLGGWGGFPEMGLLGVMTLPVALSLAMSHGPWQARAGAVIAALTAAAGVALSSSRAAWGAAVAGTMLVLVVHRRGRWPAVSVAVALALVAMLAAAAWLRPEGAVGAVTLDVASSSRLEAWRQSLELWQERPVIGWGPASYREVSLRHHERPADAQFHAHSAYLHLAVETGVVGVASAAWFAATVLAGTGRRLAAPGPLAAAARLGLVCGLLAVALRFFVDYFDPAGAGMRVMLWLSVLAGLRLALERSPDRAPA